MEQTVLNYVPEALGYLFLGGALSEVERGPLVILLDICLFRSLWAAIGNRPDRLNAASHRIPLFITFADSL
jgi:hypothetical protein